MNVEETIAHLTAELNSLRIAQNRFAREMTDLLANLEAGNMPSIDARLSALEAAVAAISEAA